MLGSFSFSKKAFLAQITHGAQGHCTPHERQGMEALAIFRVYKCMKLQIVISVVEI